MDTLFEFLYYMGFVACLSTMNNGQTVNATNIEMNTLLGDTNICKIDTLQSDSLTSRPLFLGAKQAKRLSECDTIGIYQED